MGTRGYYRCFVKDFSSIAAPLFALMKKNVEFVWTDECQTALDTLKELLTSAPMLALSTDEGTSTRYRRIRLRPAGRFVAETR